MKDVHWIKIILSAMRARDVNQNISRVCENKYYLMITNTA